MSTARHPFEPLHIQSWVDGQLTAQEASTIQAHVEACEECRAVAATIHPVSSAMARWQVETPPPSTLPGALSATKVSTRRWRTIAQVAAVLIVAVGVLWLALPNAVSNRGKALSAVAREPAADSAGAGLTVESPGIAMSELLTSERTDVQGSDVVRTAIVSFVSTDFTAARTGLERIVASAGGFIAGMDVAANRGQSQTLKATVRVPSTRLMMVLGEMKQLGTLVSESQRGEDVTNHLTDMDARLSNARETEKRLVAVLQQRTGNVSDVLEVEREIARVRRDIERMTRERERLRDRVTYATITVEIREEQTAALDLGTQSISSRFRNALIDGTAGATGALLAATLFLIRIAPSVLLVVLVCAWPARALWRRLRRTSLAPEG